MNNRNKSRELAVQVLYGLHWNPKPLAEVFEDAFFLKSKSAHREYAQTLIEGCLKHEEELSQMISKHSQNWKIQRIAIMDVIVLKMALFEMLYLKEIPHPVSINEAINLGKKFSTADSGRFINGILDQFLRSLKKQSGENPPVGGE